MNVSVTRFRLDLAEYLETVQQESVIIEKYGKPIAALVSYQSYSSHPQNGKPIRTVPKSVQKELTGYLNTSHLQPVMVESKPGQPVAVMISYQTYQQAMRLGVGNDHSIMLEECLPIIAEPLMTTRREMNCHSNN